MEFFSAVQPVAAGNTGKLSLFVVPDSSVYQELESCLIRK